MPDKDFPKLPKLPDAEFVKIDGAVFCAMIDKVLFASSIDSSRPHLCGANLSRGTDGRARFVATDGHRLANLWTTLADGVTSSANVIGARTECLTLKDCAVGQHQAGVLASRRGGA